MTNSGRFRLPHDFQSRLFGRIPVESTIYSGIEQMPAYFCPSPHFARLMSLSPPQIKTVPSSITHVPVRYGALYGCFG
jgi:hypothetical protein